MTDPPSASVRIDGVPAGRSPIVVEGLSAGAHSVEVSLDGFAPAEVGLELEAQALPVPLRFVLQPTSARLDVRAKPADASVSVDGRGLGAAPIVGVALSPGRHEIRVERTGFEPWRRSVDLAPGQELPLEATLTRSETSEGRSTALRGMGWVRAGDLASVGPGVTPPRRLSGEPARYPEAAKRQRLRGSVLVGLTVTESGHPTDIRVIESGGAILDAATVGAVRTWRYAPAEKNGVKVRVPIEVRQSYEYGR
jgi:TonB family protein